ncbi:hypothetical protein KAS42_03025 [bacterium]|nr:hypothetical protein [bacterium]
MQTGKMDSMQFEFFLDSIYESLSQEDFSVTEHNLKTALQFGYSVDDLFEIVLCDFMKRIKNDFSTVLMKLDALNNTVRILEYLGGLHKNIEGGTKRCPGLN